MEITKVKPVWVKITDAAKMLGTSRYSIKKWIGAGWNYAEFSGNAAGCPAGSGALQGGPAVLGRVAA